MTKPTILKPDDLYDFQIRSENRIIWQPLYFRQFKFRTGPVFPIPTVICKGFTKKREWTQTLLTIWRWLCFFRLLRPKIPSIFFLEQVPWTRTREWLEQNPRPLSGRRKQDWLKPSVLPDGARWWWLGLGLRAKTRAPKLCFDNSAARFAWQPCFRAAAFVYSREK